MEISGKVRFRPGAAGTEAPKRTGKACVYKQPRPGRLTALGCLYKFPSVHKMFINRVYLV